MTDALKFEQFTYSYPRRTAVLQDIDLAISAGSFTVLTGPNGAGKTALCRAAAGIIPHYYGGSLSGRVYVMGQDTRTTGIAVLATMTGILLEDYETQLAAMTVEEEVAFALENMGLPPAEIKIRVSSSLEQVGLAGLERRETAALSGGQKQRLVLASLLATKPSILILDEPASALGPKGRSELYALLHRLHQEEGLTVLAVEHDLACVLPYADQFVFLQEGCIASQGPADTVLRHLWLEESLRPALPPLWQARFRLEQTLGHSLRPWKSEAEAAAELQAYAKGDSPSC